MAVPAPIHLGTLVRGGLVLFTFMCSRMYQIWPFSYQHAFFPPHILLFISSICFKVIVFHSMSFLLILLYLPTVIRNSLQYLQIPKQEQFELIRATMTVSEILRCCLLSISTLVSQELGIPSFIWDIGNSE